MCANCGNSHQEWDDYIGMAAEYSAEYPDLTAEEREEEDEYYQESLDEKYSHGAPGY